MTLAWIFSIDEDVIQVDDDKNVKLLGQDLIDVASKANRYIKETERHDLVLEMAVSSLKSRLPFIAFFNSHPIIGAGEIQLGKLLRMTQLVKRFTDE